MTVLITGGAGYIGSHIVKLFAENGIECLVVDNLRSGLRVRIDGLCIFENIDIRNQEEIRKLFFRHEIEGIINLAALKSVEESSRIPDQYEEINTLAVESLVNLAIEYRVKTFIQSSTAAVYGDSNNGFVTESERLLPVSVYGKTKMKAEAFLNEAIARKDLHGLSLRYFNVLGSTSLRLQDTSGENLVPIVVNAIAKNSKPLIFGDDYQTKDGTCIRDYIHVDDVAKAHLAAFNELKSRQTAPAINIGTGIGYSVKEIISEILIQTGSSLIPKIASRRLGDPAILVARVGLAKDELDFEAKKTLKEMITSSIS